MEKIKTRESGMIISVERALVLIKWFPEALLSKGTSR
jgi:hypothetical protein